MVHTETTSAKDAGLRGAQVKTEVEADQSASMRQRQSQRVQHPVIIIIAVIVGFALLGAMCSPSECTQIAYRQKTP